jgi:hypothetical protein
MRRITRPFADTAATLRNIIDLGGIPPKDYSQAATAIGTLREFAAHCKANDATGIARAFQPHEVATIRRYVVTESGWNLQIDRNLGASESEVKQ